ncbi:CTP synthase [Candidatus Woesearchaeota archaeon]|nr:CTP synthase [Candidatus Woesearchaeota archaeon]
MKTRYIAVTGGVISGLGKGVVTSSLGYLLKAQGYSVTSIKIDPYINVDAGTMRPTEHGEVFVTYDGGETDQDMGTYERFLDVELSKKNNITTGQIYRTVIEKERNLEYGGKTVEVIPHIPQEIKRRIREAANISKADFVLIEIGGTVGDYQSVLFLEAVREMRLEGDDIIYVHVAYLPIPDNLGEMKTKPAQHSIRELNEIGLQPDIFIGRSEKPMDDARKEKISFICNMKKDCILSAPDLNNIYEEPIVLDDEGLTRTLLKKFSLTYKENTLKEWKRFISKIKNLNKKIKIGIVGKYFDIGDFSLEDSYVSVIESIKHAAWHNDHIPVIKWIDSKIFENNPGKLNSLDEFNGLIVPGGFGKSGVEGKILAIKYARENNIPYLGLCYGMQLAIVEYARNICGLKDAHTTEINPKTKHPVIDILPEQKKNIENSNYGATMRLGDYKAKLKKNTKIWELYGKKEDVSERHRHRYEVNPKYINILEEKGMVFSGSSPDRRLMEFMELPGQKYFVGTQGHPEFKSRVLKPHPMFNGLVKAAINKKAR